MVNEQDTVAAWRRELFCLVPGQCCADSRSIRPPVALPIGDVWLVILLFVVSWPGGLRVDFRLFAVSTVRLPTVYVFHCVCNDIKYFTLRAATRPAQLVRINKKYAKHWRCPYTLYPGPAPRVHVGLLGPGPPVLNEMYVTTLRLLREYR